jgi:hypothetical protein
MASLEQLYDRVDRLGSDAARDDSTVTREDVGNLINDARAHLTGADGAIGPWEKDLLARAEGARSSGWLRLAIVCAATALEVSGLPTAEYDYGFNYGRRT